MNTIENNKLIALFMGAICEGENNIYKIPYNENPDFAPFRVLDLNLEYNSSWDWLIPVVEKINSINLGIYNIDINKLGTHISTLESAKEIYKFETKTFEGLTSNGMLKATYKAIVQFIKWYNENKQKLQHKIKMKIYKVENYNVFPKEVTKAFGTLDDGFKISEKLGYEVINKDLSGGLETFKKVIQRPTIKDNDIVIETTFYKWLVNFASEYPSFKEAIKIYLGKNLFKYRNDSKQHKYVYEHYYFNISLTVLAN